MTDDAPPPRPWERLLTRVVAPLIGLVLLYILSVGPVAWLLMCRSERIDRAVRSAYAPLLWAGRVTFHPGVLDPYIEWWEALPGGSDDRFRLQHPLDQIVAPLPGDQELPKIPGLP